MLPASLTQPYGHKCEHLDLLNLTVYFYLLFFTLLLVTCVWICLVCVFVGVFMATCATLCGSSIVGLWELCPPFPRYVSHESLWWRQDRGTGECPVQRSQVHFLSVRVEWSSVQFWPLSGLTSHLCPSLSGDVADASAGGAWGFHHSNWGGSQCERVCGEGLQACREKHRVSRHTQVMT